MKTTKHWSKSLVRLYSKSQLEILISSLYNVRGPILKVVLLLRCNELDGRAFGVWVFWLVKVEYLNYR
jgi:hypothetical protein